MNPTTSLYTLTVRLQTKTIKQIFIPGKTNKNRRSRTQKLVIFASKENTRSHETDTCAPYLTVYEHQLKHHDMASVRSLCLIKRIYSILFSHHLLSSIFPGKKNGRNPSRRNDTISIDRIKSPRGMLPVTNGKRKTRIVRQRRKRWH